MRQPANQKLRKAIARKLRHHRVRRNMSVLELQRKTGVSRQHIRDLELASKSVTIDTLDRLCAGLKVNLRGFLKGL